MHGPVCPSSGQHFAVCMPSRVSCYDSCDHATETHKFENSPGTQVLSIAFSNDGTQLGRFCQSRAGRSIHIFGIASCASMQFAAPSHGCQTMEAMSGPEVLVLSYHSVLCAIRTNPGPKHMTIFQHQGRAFWPAIEHGCA